MLNISKKEVNTDLADERLLAVKTLQTPKASRILARILAVVAIVAIVILFLPWQQNVRGYGSVTVFSPQNRPQTVESVIAGRIESWRVVEGQRVYAGDTILVLSEVKEKFFDPDLVPRLEQQVDAKVGSIDSKERKVEALSRRIVYMKDGLRLKLLQAADKVDQSILKVTADSAEYQAELINQRVAQDQYSRFENLYDSGNISLNKLQGYELKLQEVNAKVVAKRNKLRESRIALTIARTDLNTIEADALDKISKSESELASTRAELFESEGDLAKTRNELANMQIRNGLYHIVAPQDGYLVQTLKAGIGQTIKDGEAIATIMPQSEDVAVEIFVKAMDVPLLTTGRKVRIRFDGWPSLQVAGWPQVAVGTFGGEIAVIDYIDSKGGMYRILVKPDPADEPWPEQLRVGSGVFGWAMLDNVPVWYEIWRQLNGFPPSLKENPNLETPADKERKEETKSAKA